MPSPALSPLYLGKNRSESALLSTANVNRDGTGTIVDLFTADAFYGSMVERISIMSAGAISTATSANIIRMWLKRASTYRLLAEFAIAIATPSATAGGGFLPGTSAASPFLTINKRIFGGITTLTAAADVLAFSIHTVAGTQDNYHVTAEGADYALP